VSYETLTEAKASTFVIQIVRNNKKTDGRALGSIPCMREYGGKCRIVDNAHWDSPIKAEGDTWRDVLFALHFAGIRCDTEVAL
jgi:hypothetical protein